MGACCKEMAEILYPFQATQLIFEEQDVPRRTKRQLGEVVEKTGRGGSSDASDHGNRVQANCVFALVIRDWVDL
jgi:hypothetical protein